MRCLLMTSKPIESLYDHCFARSYPPDKLGVWAKAVSGIGLNIADDLGCRGFLGV
jgi:hypothetical protein